MGRPKANTENSKKTAKACKAMKTFDISPETVKSTLKRLLEIYENNWVYIEEDNYKVLLEAILEPEPPKAIEYVQNDFKLIDDFEEEPEPEPLKKKARVKNKTLAADTSATRSNDSSGNKLLLLEYDNLHNKQPEIVLASSPNEEIKLTLSICKPPQGFRVPSINSVIKQVENTYCEKFKSLGTEFSVYQLLKDVCTSVMEQGTCSDSMKKPTKEPEKQGGPTDHDDDDGDAIQTPKFVVASEFKHVNCLNNFNSVGNRFSKRIRKLQLVVVEDSSGSSILTICPKKDDSVDFSVADITRGLEKKEISLINEFNDEKLPVFTYIQNNVVYNSAKVKFMLARISDENCCSNCSGNCLLSEIPCACATETDGEFAYTIDGLIKNEFLENCIAVCLNPKKADYIYCDNCPLERTKKRGRSGSCKGHLVRKFIKECWYKCSCGLKCGNRVVQRGIQANLQVFMTGEGKGWGVSTLENLSKGTFVCEYVGEIVTNSELFERNEENKDKKHTYPVLLDADWSSERLLKDEEALCLDATSFGNVARFINHRCEDANMIEIPVEVESPDHHYYHHAFFTTREVKAMEELTWDYGIDFDDDSHPVKAFECRCGSKSCRQIKVYKRKANN